MHWERSLVAIRERRFLSIMDLALHVVRENVPGVLGWTLAGVVPLGLLNHWVLAPALTLGTVDPDEFLFFDALVYAWLVSWEAPLATAGLTLYLGQRMFRARVDHGRIVRQWCGSIPQLLLLQGIVRGALHLVCIAFFVPYWFWPYLNEVVLLERNPLVRFSQGPNTLRRTMQLHGRWIGDLILRWLMALTTGTALALSLVLSFHTLAAMALTRQVEPWWTLHVFWPAALWTVVAFMTVVRFLSYLDLRIRHEGWEVELRLKSEALKLIQSPA